MRASILQFVVWLIHKSPLAPPNHRRATRGPVPDGSSPTLAKNHTLKDRGSIAITAALLLTLFAGSLGLGVDVAHWYDAKLKLQSAADAAVRSALLAKMDGMADDNLLATAILQATHNGFVLAKGDAELFTPPRLEEYADSNGVELVLTQTVERQFTRLFLDHDILLQAIAIALPSATTTPCITALHPSDPETVLLTGNAQINAERCEIAANSTSANAISVEGSARLNAKCIASVGAINSTLGMTLGCAVPIEYVPRLRDPYQGTPIPDLTGPCFPKVMATGNGPLPAILIPGRYCSGLTILGNAIALPGVYIIDGGDLHINGGASLIGTGVMFFLTNGAQLVTNGDANIHLSAATAGPYAGMLFFADPANGSINHSLLGSSSSVFDGALYFPQQTLTFGGGGTATDACTIIVADKVHISGNANLSSDCDHLNLNPASQNHAVRVVQ